MKRLLIAAAVVVSLALARAPAGAQTVIPVNHLASPRLAALERESRGGNRAAPESFWREAADRGAPLIEPAAGSDKYLLVTFLWRGGEGTKNVLLISTDLHRLVNEQDVERLRLSRLGGTDVWFKSYRLRRDARVTYRFSPDDPLVPPSRLKPEDQAKLSENYRPDPLNPLQLEGESIGELPDAPPQPWIKKRPGVPEGKLEERQFKSAILGNERKLIVYTPADYRAEGRAYPLMLAFTGDYYLRAILPPATLDNLIAAGAVPPMIVVGVGSAPGHHIRDLGLYEAFPEFLAKELVPWLRREYGVATDPTRTVVAGASIAGLAASFAALKHPELFGNVLSHSGSYWFKPGIVEKYQRIAAGETVEDDFAEFGALIKEYVKAPKRPVRFYLEAGLLEDLASHEPSPWKGSISLLASNRHFRDVLQAKGYEVHYREFNGGHSAANWRGAAADGLIALIGGPGRAGTRRSAVGRAE
ncbi:MAG TPA: alpha/beta hydrolase-fold protein [Pyrinomonadaceae bacterium]